MSKQTRPSAQEARHRDHIVGEHEPLCAGSGWEIVCPDGRVRGCPYMNHGDAVAMAELKTTTRCQCWPKPSAADLVEPTCPEGVHRVRVIDRASVH